MKLVNKSLEEQIDMEIVYSEYKKGIHRLIIDFDNHFEVYLTEDFSWIILGSFFRFHKPLN